MPTPRESMCVFFVEELNAQTDVGRGPQRGGFAKTTPEARAVGALARR